MRVDECKRRIELAIYRRKKNMFRCISRTICEFTNLLVQICVALFSCQFGLAVLLLWPASFYEYFLDTALNFHYTYFEVFRFADVSISNAFPFPFEPEFSMCQ